MKTLIASLFLATSLAFPADAPAKLTTEELLELRTLQVQSESIGRRMAELRAEFAEMGQRSQAIEKAVTEKTRALQSKYKCEDCQLQQDGSWLRQPKTEAAKK